MASYDLVIKGGTVIDGLRTPRFKADVGIADGRITQIGRISAAEGAQVVDGSGKIVAPGVVDLHTHYDSQIFWDPWCTMSAWHGVTSVVIGNCGFGFAPCKPEDRQRAMLSLSRNEAVPLKTMQAGMPWDWVTFAEYLESVDRTPKGVNVMSFVPLAPLYGYVVGIDKAKEQRVSDEELKEMCRLLTEGMEVGGCGWSSQISGELGNVQLDYDGTPMVTDCMTEREIRAFCQTLASLGRGTTQITGSLDTAAFIARESGRPIIWNGLMPDGTFNQHGAMPEEYRHAAVLQRLTQLNQEEGLRVFAQVHTVNFASEFTLEDYNLADSIPCWREACIGTVEEKLVKFADPARRQAMKEVHEVRGGLFGAGYPLDDIKVHWISSDVPNAGELKDTYEGWTIGEIAAREGKHPLDAFLDVAVAGRLCVGFATPLMLQDPDSLRDCVTSPMALPGIGDGGAHTKFVTTARFPTEMLSLWVREHELLSAEEAHWRLSYYPAMAAGLKGRGYLAEGGPADVIVYDPDTVAALPQERVWDYPAGEWRLIQRSVGYDRTVVNGVTTFIDGQCTNATPGRLLRHGTD